MLMKLSAGFSSLGDGLYDFAYWAGGRRQDEYGHEISAAGNPGRQAQQPARGLRRDLSEIVTIVGRPVSPCSTRTVKTAHCSRCAKMIRYSVREAARRAIHAGAARQKARTVKTRIPRDGATARRPGRPIPAAMGTAGWAQAEADRARIRSVLRAPPDWKAPATTSVPASTTQHGAPIAAPADIVRTDGYALDPARPRAGEQAETIAKHGSRMRIHTEAEATQSAHAIDATALRAQPVLLQRKCVCGANASGLTGECAECSKKKMVGLQTKLRINEAGDIYEHEADRVAEQVLAKPARPHVSGAPPRIQRFSGQSSGQTGAAPASVDRALASPGRPLDPALRQDMEHRFGQDFSRVRVHSDVASEMSARQLDAYAYTSGYDIVFGSGRFAPATPAGRRLLAHELTHVVQQSRETDGLQTKLLQRDGPHKAGDVTEEEKDALLNFKNDWENNFSHYDKLVTISGRSYDKNQKEGLKAVKTTGNAISIILGKPYATEANEQTRWKWIKTEVIDKNIKTDKFEEVAYDPTHSKLKEIGPPICRRSVLHAQLPGTGSFARSISQNRERIAGCMQPS